MFEVVCRLAFVRISPAGLVQTNGAALVAAGDEGLDGRDQFAHAGEAAAVAGLTFDDGKPRFDQVEPRRRGGAVDGSRAAHWEHPVAVTEHGPRI